MLFYHTFDIDINCFVATPKSELQADAFNIDGTEMPSVVYLWTPSLAPVAFSKLGDGVTASTRKPEYLYGGYVITDPIYMWGNFEEFRTQMDYEFLSADYSDGTKSGLLFYSFSEPCTDETCLDMTTMQRALEIPELNKALYNDI